MDGFALAARHVDPALADVLRMTGRDHQVVKASGNLLHCASGRVLKDWIAGFGSLNLGHNPPGPLRALLAHAESGAASLLVESLQPEAGALAQFLTAQAGTGFETCHFSNSGTEAVEAALKLAMAATGRHEFLYCRGAYHGVTMGSLALMAEGDFRDPFEPALPRWHGIALNDATALREVLATRRFAALVVEPIQVESGVHACDAAFLAAAREACDASGSLLVFDEVQTGMGRTGSLFHFQQTGVLPDVVTLAKSLGAGLVPIGATLARAGLARRAYGGYRRAGIHQSTYGGNALACRVGLAAARELADVALLDVVRQRSAWLEALADRHLRAHPLVERVAFHGLLGVVQVRVCTHPWFDAAALGLDTGEQRSVSGHLIVRGLYRRGLLLQVCGHDWRCIRIQPPLTVSATDCEELIVAMRAELDWLHGHE